MKNKLPNKQVVGFIEEAARQGISRADIKISLAAQDFAHDQIKDAFRETDRLAHTKDDLGPALPPAPSKPAVPQISTQPAMPGSVAVPPRPAVVGPASVIKEQHKTSSLKSKILVISIAVVVLLGISFAVVWAVDTFIIKVDSFTKLLPKDAPWYIAINTDAQSDQVIEFQEALMKLPLAEDLAGVFSEMWEVGLEESLAKQGLDSFLPYMAQIDEIVIAQLYPVPASVGALELDSAKLNTVIIAKGLTDTQLLKIGEDVQGSDLAWQMSKYRGQLIFSLEIDNSQSEIEMIDMSGVVPGQLNVAVLDGFIVLADKRADLEQVIDIYKDQSLMSFLKLNKDKSLAQNSRWQKMSKNFSDSYLALGYAADLEINEIGSISNQLVSDRVSSLMKKDIFSASLLPPYIGVDDSDISLIKDIVTGQVVRMENGSIKVDSYLLDLRTGDQFSAPFSPTQSLANVLPEKMDGRWVDFYGEGRNLKGTIAQIEKAIEQLSDEALKALAEPSSASADLEVQQTLDFFDKLLTETFDTLDQYLGIDLKKDLLPYADGNFAYFVAPAFDGSRPVTGLIIEVNDPEQVKSNLQKMRLNVNVFNEIFMSLFTYAATGSVPEDGIEVAEKLLPPSPPAPFMISMHEGVEVMTSGQEVSEWPLLGDFIYFSYAIKDNKLIIGNTIQAVKDIITSLDSDVVPKLAQSVEYKRHFSNLPDNVEGLSYQYLYGFWGLINYSVSDTLDTLYSEDNLSILDTMSAEQMQQQLAQIKEEMLQPIGALLVPYLKAIKSSSSYYVIEDDMEKNYQTIYIEEISEEEKAKVLQGIEMLMDSGITNMLVPMDTW